jgi:radical SAM enzyme (TIGR01210 family)
MASYPPDARARDLFVLDRRPARDAHDPLVPQSVLVEPERTAQGVVAQVATVFLTGRECPWHCVMCDLWRHTIETDTPPGAIPAQIAGARERIRLSHGDVDRMKLYNSGSFFDPRAVPERDYDSIAIAVSGLVHLVVESHPALVGLRTERLLEALRRHAGPASLEVAMGLETAHRAALDQINKRMTVESFARAAAHLERLGVALRVFLLVSPPFVPEDEQDEWLLRSVDVAIETGASVVSLIPTRTGNGAINALAANGSFRSPRLADLERSLALSLDRVPTRYDGATRTRVFADLWDLDRFADCPICLDARRARLHTMNLDQRVLPPVVCGGCNAGQLS